MVQKHGEEYVLVVGFVVKPFHLGDEVKECIKSVSIKKATNLDKGHSQESLKVPDQVPTMLIL